MMRGLIIGLMSLGSFVCGAQILSNIGQFQYVRSVNNPAVVGSSTALRANLLNRSQFISFFGNKAASNTQLFTIDAPINNQIGIGGVAQLHRIGAIRQIDITANGSYRISFDQESFLQFGLKTGMSQFNSNFSGFKIRDEGDEFIENGVNGSVIRFGTGAFYKRGEFYAGLSSPDLINIDIGRVFFDDQEQKSTLQRNFVANLGTKIQLNEFMSLLPVVMVRYYTGRPINYFINTGLELNQTLLLGLSVVNPRALGAYTRVTVSPKIKAGFHYEFSNRRHDLGTFNSLEIMVSYGFD